MIDSKRRWTLSAKGEILSGKSILFSGLSEGYEKKLNIQQKVSKDDIDSYSWDRGAYILPFIFGTNNTKEEETPPPPLKNRGITYIEHARIQDILRSDFYIAVRSSLFLRGKPSSDLDFNCGTRIVTFGCQTKRARAALTLFRST